MAKFYPSAEKLTASMISTLEHLQFLEALQLSTSPSDPWPTSATPASTWPCSSSWKQTATRQGSPRHWLLRDQRRRPQRVLLPRLGLEPVENWKGENLHQAALRRLASRDQERQSLGIHQRYPSVALSSRKKTSPHPTPLLNP